MSLPTRSRVSDTRGEFPFAGGWRRPGPWAAVSLRGAGAISPGGHWGAPGSGIQSMLCKWGVRSDAEDWPRPWARPGAGSRAVSLGPDGARPGVEVGSGGTARQPSVWSGGGVRAGDGGFSRGLRTQTRFRGHSVSPATLTSALAPATPRGQACFDVRLL